MVTRVCVSVCVCLSVRGRTPTLLHEPVCYLGGMVEAALSCDIVDYPNIKIDRIQQITYRMTHMYYQ